MEAQTIEADDVRRRSGNNTDSNSDVLPAGLSAALNTEQASSYTGLAVATLEGLRCRGGGPRFVRYGRKAVRYLVRDLDAWIEERIISNTSEVGRLGGSL